ncbi:MAG: TrkA C-terminal domain-containing protein [Nitrospiraceae bacterium]
MTTEFLQRIRKEVSVTQDAVREIVIGLSERVNRKVQTLKLHWRAASLSDQRESALQELGAYLASLLVQTSGLPERDSERLGAEARVVEAASLVRGLKKESMEIDALVRELEADALREDLLRIQQDLTVRAATLERISVPQGSSVLGQPVSHLSLPPATRVVAVCRGPAFLAVDQHLVLRAGDIVILVGPRTELKTAVSQFIEPQRVSA